MTAKKFILKARELAPKYCKATHSMASNPAYGVVLRSDVAAHIRGTPERRAKPCKLTSRMTEAIRDEFNSAKAVLGHTTDQDAIEYAVLLYIEKAAASAGTENDGKTNKTTIIIRGGGEDVNERF